MAQFVILTGVTHYNILFPNAGYLLYDGNAELWLGATDGMDVKLTIPDEGEL